MSDETPSLLGEPAGAAKADPGYRVLARKYRPATFAEMIGQEALVRTLTNAIRSGRIAHAFILTGVRGVGKTTTARIIARALNCVGPDGTGGPTAEPCGLCEPCRSIAAERNVDVMEMDAASRTGVDDVREIIDAVRYGPVSLRFKVYIIDEIHMLSRPAFNALLKTLEEPPPHVKFVFATTEIRKVPVTVLSRCQRFDLRRVEAEVLALHFAGIAQREGVAIDGESLAMIARAADGSVRDGLSLLDQAIALSPGGVSAEVTAGMLGLADRSLVLDLFEALMAGDAPAALAVADGLIAGGADPVVVLQDLLEATHTVTRLKLLPDLKESAGLPEAERVRGGALAARLPMPVLSRAWQMLLKGVGEVQAAPAPAAALEMVLIRLVHAAGLPTPADLLRRVEQMERGGTPAAAGSPPLPPAAPRPAAPVTPVATAAAAPALAPRAAPAAGAQAAARSLPQASATPMEAAPAPAEPEPKPEPEPDPMPADFPAMVALFERRGEPVLHAHLATSVHLVRYEAGERPVLEFRPREGAPSALASQIMGKLQAWTGRRWMVGISPLPGAPTLAEQGRQAQARAKEEAALHPTVRAVLESFPGATIVEVHDLAAEAADAPPADEPAEATDEATDEAKDS